MFVNLGFLPHPTKCSLTPSREVVSLGFVLNSVTMQISMQPEKVVQIIEFACEVLARTCTVKEVAWLIGLFVSCFRATPLGKLHYQSLEQCKVKALHAGRGHYSAKCLLSSHACKDINWWISVLPHTWALIHHPLPKITIFCDACSYGYGGVCDSLMTQGHFDPEFKSASINTKECLAVLYSVQAFADKCGGKHILIRSDNMTVLSNITNMGSMSSLLWSKIMKDLWQIVFGMGAWLTIQHLTGSLNSAADAMSCLFHNDRSKWGLPMSMFHEIDEQWGPLQVDLFASSANTKLPRFIAWQLDRGALTVDAFTVHWKQFGLCYSMPPFALIGRVLRRLNTERIPLILVVPLWESQPWFQCLLDMICNVPLLLPRSTKLYLPWDPLHPHLLQGQLQLMAVKLSGNPSDINDFWHGEKSMLSIQSSQVPINPS